MINKITLNLHKVMAVPAIVLFSIFFIYPLTRGIGLSMTDWDGMREPNFIGIRNFIEFFGDARARNDIFNTVFFAIGSAPLLNIFGLMYALLLDSKIRGKKLARVIVYLPAIISPLIMGYIWYFILQPGRGFLFHALTKINMESLLGNWMMNYKAAMWVLILVNVWQYVGMTMIVYLAGLQSISIEIYESSKIDGAGYFKRLWYIVFPLLIPAIRINIVTNIIGSLAVFDIIMALTEGGPGYSTESLSIYIMRMAYGSYTGYSTAVAMILFIIILIPVILFMKLLNKKVVGKI